MYKQFWFFIASLEIIWKKRAYINSYSLTDISRKIKRVAMKVKKKKKKTAEDFPFYQ